MKLTIAISKGDKFFIGRIKEIPEVVTQGGTLEETRSNVLDALQLYLEDIQSEKTDPESYSRNKLSFSYFIYIAYFRKSGI